MGPFSELGFDKFNYVLKDLFYILYMCYQYCSSSFYSFIFTYKVFLFIKKTIKSNTKKMETFDFWNLLLRGRRICQWIQFLVSSLTIYMTVNLFILFLQSLYSQIISVFIIHDNFRACHVHLLNHNFFYLAWIYKAHILFCSNLKSLRARIPWENVIAWESNISFF